MRVVEYTGGSTGSSLAMVCAIKGYEFHPYGPAFDLARELGPGKVVATVACDTGLKYLAGDPYK